MHQVMKLVGLTPAHVPRIHDVLASEAVMSDVEVEVEAPTEGRSGSPSWVSKRIPLASLLSCRWDKEHHTYTAEIKVLITYWEDGNEFELLHTTRNVVDAIHDALDIYPREIFRKSDIIIWRDPDNEEVRKWVDKYGPGPFVVVDRMATNDHDSDACCYLSISNPPPLPKIIFNRLFADSWFKRVT